MFSPCYFHVIISIGILNCPNDSYIFMAAHTSQTTTSCSYVNFTIRPSTRVYESRILSSVYVL